MASETSFTVQLSELERHVQRLEDVEAIKRLKAKYARFCDQSYNPEELGRLFTEDAVWDGATFGVFHGQDQIRQFFASASHQIPWAFHLMIGPEIEVDGSGAHATGLWYLFQPCTMTSHDNPNEKEPVLQMAKYEDTYRKVDGEWKFAHVRIRYEAITNLFQGWVTHPFRS